MATPPSKAVELPQGLYALCDDGVAPELPLEEQARRVLAGGARVLQLRMKRTPGGRAVAAARGVVGLCREAGAVCIVNDRVDWALLAEADGVHLGEEDLPPREARALLGPRALLGVTVRDLAMLEEARAAGASYVGLGPVFPTATKAVAAPVCGVEGLRAVCRGASLPVVAIGGIGLANIAEVARAGARGAAVVSDLLRAEDIPRRAAQLQEEFQRGVGLRTLVPARP